MQIQNKLRIIKIIIASSTLAAIGTYALLFYLERDNSTLTQPNEAAAQKNREGTQKNREGTQKNSEEAQKNSELEIDSELNIDSGLDIDSELDIGSGLDIGSELDIDSEETQTSRGVNWANIVPKKNRGLKPNIVPEINTAATQPNIVPKKNRGLKPNIVPEINTAATQPNIVPEINRGLKPNIVPEINTAVTQPNIVREINYSPLLYTDSIKLPKTEKIKRVHAALERSKGMGLWAFIAALGKSLQMRIVLLDEVSKNTNLEQLIEKEFGTEVVKELQKIIKKHAPMIYKNHIETEKTEILGESQFLSIGDVLVRQKMHIENDKEMHAREVILLNKGTNTCFLNTAIHILLGIPEIQMDLWRIDESYISKAESDACVQSRDREVHLELLSLKKTFGPLDIFSVVRSLQKILKVAAEYKKKKDSELLDTIHEEKMKIYHILDKKMKLFKKGSGGMRDTYSLGESKDAYTILYNMMVFFYHFCPYICNGVEVQGKRVVQMAEVIQCTISYKNKVNGRDQDIIYKWDKENEVTILTNESHSVCTRHFVNCEEHTYHPVYIPEISNPSETLKVRKHISSIFKVKFEHVHVFVHNQQKKTWRYSPPDNKEVVDGQTDIYVFYYIPETKDPTSTKPLFLVDTPSPSNKKQKGVRLPVFVNEFMLTAMKAFGYVCNKKPLRITNLREVNERSVRIYVPPQNKKNNYFSGLYTRDDANIDFRVTQGSIDITNDRVAFLVRVVRRGQYYCMIVGNSDDRSSNSVNFLCDAHNCNVHGIALFYNDHYVAYVASNNASTSPNICYIYDDGSGLEKKGMHTPNCISLDKNYTFDYMILHPDRKAELQSLGFNACCVEMLLS
ncbi:hypothetical protein NEAUS03_0813 [Nematocida ausubeli]|nr:hypothetical protein NEAUS03_0813 [Nematocida ausubeli]